MRLRFWISPAAHATFVHNAVPQRNQHQLLLAFTTKLFIDCARGSREGSSALSWPVCEHGCCQWLVLLLADELGAQDVSDAPVVLFKRWSED
jgi:hypothetical protein